MKKLSRNSKKIISTKANKLAGYNNIELQEFDKLNHAVELYKLFPEFSKNTNIGHLSFKEFYVELIKGLDSEKISSYAIINNSYKNVIGFFIFEKVFPFIVNAHIVVNPKYRNLYNAINASRKVINKLFKTETKQIITYLKKKTIMQEYC